MTPDETLQSVTSLAQQYYTRKDVSWRALFEASGFTEHPESITEERLRAKFEQHPDLMKFWMMQSADRRSEGTVRFASGREEQEAAPRSGSADKGR
ncbi:MAG: RNA-binding protein [Acidobacteriota bacterium]